jgi:2-oxoglutarate ferredoxin oxidoreductase subunit delta
MADKRKVHGYITIDSELCKGCYLCLSVCPKEVITKSERLNQKGYYPAKFEEDEEKGKMCIACVQCATICPDIAIEVYRD